MPLAAARIFLRQTYTRIERLHDISEEHASAESVLQEEFKGEIGWRD